MMLSPVADEADGIDRLFLCSQRLYRSRLIVLTLVMTLCAVI